MTSRFFQNRGNSRVEYGVALKYARVGTRRALVTRGPAGFVRVYTTDYLTAEIYTNFAPTSIRAWRWMGSLPVSSWATYVF